MKKQISSELLIEATLSPRVLKYFNKSKEAKFSKEIVAKAKELLKMFEKVPLNEYFQRSTMAGQLLKSHKVFGCQMNVCGGFSDENYNKAFYGMLPFGYEKEFDDIYKAWFTFMEESGIIAGFRKVHEPEYTYYNDGGQHDDEDYYEDVVMNDKGHTCTKYLLEHSFNSNSKHFGLLGEFPILIYKGQQKTTINLQNYRKSRTTDSLFKLKSKEVRVLDRPESDLNETGTQSNNYATQKVPIEIQEDPDYGGVFCSEEYPHQLNRVAVYGYQYWIKPHTLEDPDDSLPEVTLARIVHRKDFVALTLQAIIEKDLHPDEDIFTILYRASLALNKTGEFAKSSTDAGIYGSPSVYYSPTEFPTRTKEDFIELYEKGVLSKYTFALLRNKYLDKINPFY